jgi:hypothetical protein
MSAPPIWSELGTDRPHIFLLLTKQARWSMLAGQWEKGHVKHGTWFNPGSAPNPVKVLSCPQQDLHTDALIGIDTMNLLTRIEGTTPAFDTPKWTLLITGAAALLIRKRHLCPA